MASGFYDAIQLELAAYKNDLIFQSEVGLNTMPILVDVLVIKKSSNKPIENEIGKYFKGHNLFEYKSPQDELNIDTFFKGIGYACLYKTRGERVNSIAADNMTLTFVKEGKPIKLLKQLESQGFQIQPVSKGIYQILGKIPFEIHIIVSKELPKEEHLWLTVLTDKLTREQAENLVFRANELQKKDEKEHGDSVLQAAMQANKPLFDLIKEDTIMCEALRELMRPEMEAAINDAVTKAEAKKDVIIAEKDDLILLLQAQLAEARKQNKA